ncbi:uncharacterized protein E0L32_012410 [Thyridium curvatum]|uniref:Citrate transporter-like domain-containing protein n=1 Tax=Thyridium curvatum TaxID=1093900 RepID=A0A507BHY2_9PEZI|nr:uncharacterized protein E0L32_012410 [Thyridium curvatum]TPX16601.1 hypothetical protein E0L32_012410 [Thyridium curvatum]
MALTEVDVSTERIKQGDWKSIITLVVFVITNIIVLFPFHIPVWVPTFLVEGFLGALRSMRIISPERHDVDQQDAGSEPLAKKSVFTRLHFPVNFLTAPLIADLFLLAIGAIARQEVYNGTVGANNIHPIDIMVFFITLAYIAISIDASGLIRYLAFKVLQWGGKRGDRLFFYLYTFFFALGSFIGNDPIILSGTAFLAYMTRVSSNIIHPRAWIFTQFAIANIASAILVSSNPTNLVLAGAFDIKFITYTANMIVPVVVTAILLFPFLLYIVFANESLIPMSIKMHELDPAASSRKPVNPNIPNARGLAEEEEDDPANTEQGKLLSLEEIMNPFLDKGGAAFGGIIMAATLITVLALNAASQGTGEHQVYWVTLPAAFVMFCWDMTFGWLHRKETRSIARKGREEIERARAIRAIEAEDQERRRQESTSRDLAESPSQQEEVEASKTINANETESQRSQTSEEIAPAGHSEKRDDMPSNNSSPGVLEPATSIETEKVDEAAELEVRVQRYLEAQRAARGPTTLTTICEDRLRWAQETFPTVSAVLMHLPFALIPFAFCMFVLVEALGSKGWVPVFAYGWDHWVNKTGTIGAISGMAFLSTILCNFAGTNIGTTILLSRVIQAWATIHHKSGVPISDRDFWATVYSMAIGVNYGAFSTAFSASLAGLLWRDILARKHIHVKALDFARVNLPIIAVSMIIGCVVLIGEVYIMRGNGAYIQNW